MGSQRKRRGFLANVFSICRDQQKRDMILFACGCVMIPFLFVQGILNRMDMTQDSTVHGAFRKQGNQLGSGARVASLPEEYLARVNFEQCNWLKSLLEEDQSLSNNLPEPGKPRSGGNVFWLKRPLLHTKSSFDSIPAFKGLPPVTKTLFSKQIDRNGEVEIMILRYNVYSKDPKWTQHTEKYTNTVRTLKETTLTGSTLFPKLYASCSNIDGFHTIAVEFISDETHALPSPGSLEGCVDRADEALSMFQSLEEDFGRVLVDFKKGQWMSRGIVGNGRANLVLQDVDDIVVSGSPNPYKDQVAWFKNDLARANHMDESDIDNVWTKLMFPNGQYNIRYDVFGTEVLINDLGFKWNERDCPGTTANFKTCLKNLIHWSKSVESSYPKHRDLREALTLCYNNRNVDN